VTGDHAHLSLAHVHDGLGQSALCTAQRQLNDFRRLQICAKPAQSQQ